MLRQKTSSPISVRDTGMVTAVRLSHQAKLRQPMWVSPSGRTRTVSGQAWKAMLPMEVTVLGMVTEVICA